MRARRQLEHSDTEHTLGYAIATAGLGLGIVLSLAWGFVGACVLVSERHRIDPPAPVATLLEPQRQLSTQGSSSSPPGPTPTWVAPRLTRTASVGSIAVVDVGLSVSSLAEELRNQGAQAAKAGKTLLVMTTTTACNRCRGVDGSLRDPSMQVALARVLLVRVDREAFEEDSERLHIPTDRFPGFFLLSPNGTPRDGIDGGEWDDDIAANIAPVLGAFVRGKYKLRRQGFHRAPGFEITL